MWGRGLGEFKRNYGGGARGKENTMGKGAYVCKRKQKWFRWVKLFNIILLENENRGWLGISQDYEKYLQYLIMKNIFSI